MLNTSSGYVTDWPAKIDWATLILVPFEFSLFITGLKQHEALKGGKGNTKTKTRMKIKMKKKEKKLVEL